LKELNPIEQVAGQVYYTNKAIQDGINQISSKNTLVVNYEDFCIQPRLIFDQIEEKFSQQGYTFSWEYNGPKKFQSTNRKRLTEEVSNQVIEAYNKISEDQIELR
jgi:hypothetical protein